MARDAIELALPRVRHWVDWWGLPTRVEWSLAPDRGAGVTKLGPWLRAWLSGVCVGFVWVQGVKSKALFLLQVAFGRPAGMLRPVAEVLAVF